MTKKALVKQADLLRMAKVAKEFGVIVWHETNGVKVCVGPPDCKEATKLPQWPDDSDKWRERQQKLYSSKLAKSKRP